MKAPRLQVLGARAANRLVPWLPIRNPLTSKELTKNLEEQRLCDRDPLYNRTVTPRWFLECNVAQERILRSGSNVRLPVLAFCGSGDTVAAPDATRAFFQTIASQEKRFKEYPGMLHECLNEIGREEVWQDISRWISERV